VAGTLRSVWNTFTRLPIVSLFRLPALPSIQTAIAQGELGRDLLMPLPHPTLPSYPGTRSSSFGQNTAYQAAKAVSLPPASPPPVTALDDKSAAQDTKDARKRGIPSAEEVHSHDDAHPGSDVQLGGLGEEMEGAGDTLLPAPLHPIPPGTHPFVIRPAQPVAQRVELSAEEMLLAPEEDLVIKNPVSYLMTTLVGIDESGHRFMRRQLDALASLRGTSAIRALGLCNLRHLSDAPAALEPVVGETIDISITAAEVAAALERSHQPQQAEELLVNHLFDKVVRVNKGLLEGQGLLLVAQNIRSLPRSVRALSILHKRLPRFTIVVIGFLPTPDRYDQQFAAGASALRQLQREGAIACTLLVDPNSPLAQARGVAGQEQLLAKSLASLLVEPAHERDNLAPSEVFTRLGEHTPFIALSASSASVVAGEGPLPAAGCAAAGKG
jgi:hypothetical protein